MKASPKHSSSISISEGARYLGISIHALERWIRQGAVPCERYLDTYRFNKSQLKEWAQAHNMAWNEQVQKASPLSSLSLSAAIQAGGVYSQLKGNDVESTLQTAVKKMAIPDGLDRKELLAKLLERESLASTGIGHGVAVPHPRTPLQGAVPAPVITVAFLDPPVDWKAIDSEPVFVLFLMLSPDTKTHLKLLSKLSFCLREKNFLAYLRTGPDRQSLCQRIEEMEIKMEETK